MDLSNFFLLKDLQPQQVQEFIKTASFKVARKGEVIYSKADSNKIFFVHSGVVKLVEIRENGSEAVKDILTSNDMFGGFSMEEVHVPNYEYAKALTAKTTYFSIDLLRFKQMIRENSSISFNFYCGLAHKINRLENKCSNLAFTDTRDRLLHFLRELSAKEKSITEGKLEIKNYLTQDEMAKMIYVSRQTLSRVLKDLRNSGELIYTRSKIQINKVNSPSI